MVAKRRGKLIVQIRASNEAVNGVPATAQASQPTGQEHREPAVAVDVARQADGSGSMRKNALVEGRDHIADNVLIDRRLVPLINVNLDPGAEGSESRFDGQIVACR